MKYSVKDLQRALTYLEDKFKVNQVTLEIDDRDRIHLSTTDMEANSVRITVYRNSDEGTKMPEVTKTERLT